MIAISSPLIRETDGRQRVPNAGDNRGVWNSLMEIASQEFGLQ
jgi:hypothetical protein